MGTFNTDQNKIQKMWEQSQSTEKNINRTKRLSIDFDPSHFSKLIFRASILSDELLIDDSGGIVCWVAVELYGSWYDKRVKNVQNYMYNIAPRTLFYAYLKHGRCIAKFLRKFPIFKIFFYPFFTYFSIRGMKRCK